MNIEEAEDVAMEYGVSAVPTFLLFKNGDMLPEEKITGAHHLKVKEMIVKNVKS
jgi:thioredoxin-like negative regulator of GroEL